MADDRPVETTEDQVGRLQRELDDFKSTILVRVGRGETGDVEPTIRTTAKENMLLLQGQAVSRTAYPALWAWAQAQSLVVTGMFTVGDGSTTFGLPDFRGRVPVGVGTLGSDSYAIGALGGAASKVIALANLPAHVHGVTVATHGNHGHNLTGGSVPGGGAHGGHFPSESRNVTAGGDYGVAIWNGAGSGVGDHGHGAVGVFADANSAGSHSVNENSVGSASPTAIDTRPPYIAINWAIWI